MTLLNKYIFLIFLVSILWQCKEQNVDQIDISGDWIVRLDSLDKGIKEEWFSSQVVGQKINLPSTLDEAKIGDGHHLPLTLTNDVLSNLARKHQYIGKAWYEREIEVPADWQGEIVALELERIIWKSTLYVNGKRVKNSNNSLTTKHAFEVGSFLKPGMNRLTVLIDNTDQYPLVNVESDKYPNLVNREMANAYTNHTQMWKLVITYPKMKYHLNSNQLKNLVRNYL